ncbi:MAG: hypothetical protein KDD53_12530, partial [Bdellovibrionales bacterium]|nr:hypothetical protein [Bdellovibrionales bacterium]
MADVLILGDGEKRVVDLATLAQNLGAKVKSAIKFDVALEMVRTRPFDLVFVSHGYPISALEELSEIVWENNPTAPFVVFDLAADSERKLFRNKWELSLKGFEYTEPPETLFLLQSLVEGAKKRKSLSS